jgi:hypothetical protein
VQPESDSLKRNERSKSVSKQATMLDEIGDLSFLNEDKFLNSSVLPASESDDSETSDDSNSSDSYNVSLQEYSQRRKQLRKKKTSVRSVATVNAGLRNEVTIPILHISEKILTSEPDNAVMSSHVRSNDLVEKRVSNSKPVSDDATVEQQQQAHENTTIPTEQSTSAANKEISSDESSDESSDSEVNVTELSTESPNTKNRNTTNDDLRSLELSSESISSISALESERPLATESIVSDNQRESDESDSDTDSDSMTDFKSEDSTSSDEEAQPRTTKYRSIVKLKTLNTTPRAVESVASPQQVESESTLELPQQQPEVVESELVQESQEDVNFKALEEQEPTLPSPLATPRKEKQTEVVIENVDAISDASFEDGVDVASTDLNRPEYDSYQDPGYKYDFQFRTDYNTQGRGTHVTYSSDGDLEESYYSSDESDDEPQEVRMNLLDYMKIKNSPEQSESPKFVPVATYRPAVPLSAYQLHKLQQIHTQQEFKEKSADYAMEKAFEGLQNSVHRVGSDEVVDDFLQPKRKVMYDMLKRGYGSRALGVSPISSPRAEPTVSAEDEFEQFLDAVSPRVVSQEQTLIKPYISKLNDNTQNIIKKKINSPRNLDEIIHRLTSPIPKEKTYRKPMYQSHIRPDHQPMLSPGTKAMFSDSGPKDFHTRQDSFLEMKKSKIEARRTQEEQDKQRIQTYKPHINKSSKSIKRSVDNLFSWHTEALAKRRRKKEMEVETETKGFSFKPQLSSRTEKIMQRKARRGNSNNSSLNDSSLLYMQ